MVFAVAGVIGIASASAGGPPEEFVSVAYGTDDGVPQPIEDVLQMPDGYIWAATQGGIVRFDGLRFRLYRMSNTPELPSNSINVLCAGRDGALWIGTGRGLVRYADGHFQRIGLPNDIVTTIAVDGEGRLWVGATSGVYRRTATGELQRVTEIPLPTGSRAWRLSTDREGRVWLASPSMPLQVYAHGALRTFAVGGREIADPVSVAEASDGTLWVASDTHGVYRVRGDRMDHFGAAEGLGVNVTVRGFVDSHDRVWIGGYGVWLLDPHAGNRFVRVLPQLKEHVRGMSEDREGNLWLGTIADGLVRVRGTGFQLYNRERGLPARIVKNVVEDPAGNLWISVERESPVRIAPDGTIRQFRVEEGYDTDIRSMIGGADGSLWIGYRDRLQIWRDGKVENLPEYAAARALFRDHTGAIWIGRDNVPVERWRDGKFEQVGGRNGVPAGVAIAFAEGPHGEIYIGYLRDGLARIADGKVTVFRAATGLPDDELRAIYPDSEGNLWIGTKNRGFAVRVDGKWLNPDAFVDLAQDSVAAILEDNDGRMFFGTGKGVITAKKADILAMARGGRPARFQLLAVSDGVGSCSVWSAFQPVACAGRDGTLWFCTRQGLMGINPHNIPVNREPPPVEIQRVLADDLEIAPQANTVTVAAATHTVVFEYAALSFSRPRQVRFKYKLEGYDRDWVDGGTQREARYVRLPPNTYRFHVIAANEDGVWNQVGAQLSVVRLPHVYQTWWFYAAAGLGVVASVFGAHRWRTRVLRGEKARLEEAVAARTAEVAKSYETLRSTERELLETSRLAGIAEMATGVLHNIGNALNSLTVSASVLVSRSRQSKSASVARLARIMPAERDALLAFYANDPRALLLPKYLTELAGVLQKENHEVTAELEALRAGVNHINDIVADQQSVARVDAVTESIAATDLVEFALRMTEASLARHGIEVRREFIDRPVLRVARQKVLQVLVNLTRNATEALDTVAQGQRTLVTRVRLVGAGRVSFEMEDNGPGIAPEHLTKIFNFGFTTKKNGHGFGLHNSALAAREMGGSLVAFSKGIGQGARFVFELPIEPPAAAE